jgi:ribosomal protein L20A (L18A)
LNHGNTKAISSGEKMIGVFNKKRETKKSFSSQNKAPKNPEIISNVYSSMGPIK